MYSNEKNECNFIPKFNKWLYVYKSACTGKDRVVSVLKHPHIETYDRVDIKLRAFSVMALDGGEWLASCSSPQNPLHRRLDGHES
jgi:hypothetical protein